MKRQLLIIILLLVSNFSIAQKIKFKRGKVFANGKEVLKFETKDSATEFYIYDLEGNEIIFAKDITYYTFRIIFIEKDIEFVTREKFNSNRGFIRWLFKNKVFDVNGKLDDKKIKLLIRKYEIDD